MRTLREIVNALRYCSATLAGKQVCDACSYRCLVDRRIELLDDAAAALAPTLWRDPVNDPPKKFVPVIVAREYEKGKPLRIEQGAADVNGWWKVPGTRVKKIVAWKPMPAAPEKGDLPWKE